MARPNPTAPHNATATYICDSDPQRKRTYPFREGAEIPRTVEFEGLTYSLRAVMYEAEGLEITRAA